MLFNLLQSVNRSQLSLRPQESNKFHHNMYVCTVIGPMAEDHKSIPYPNRLQCDAIIIHHFRNNYTQLCNMSVNESSWNSYWQQLHKMGTKPMLPIYVTSADNVLVAKDDIILLLIMRRQTDKTSCRPSLWTVGLAKVSLVGTPTNWVQVLLSTCMPS